MYQITYHDENGHVMSAQVGPNHPEVTIGRNKNNQMPISSMSLSRFHAKVIYHDGQLYLVDLKSSNGCYVNGRRITQQIIQPNDSIQCGEVHLQLMQAEVSPQAPAPMPQVPAPMPSQARPPVTQAAASISGQATMPPQAAMPPQARPPMPQPSALMSGQAPMPPQARPPMPQAPAPMPQVPQQVSMPQAPQQQRLGIESNTSDDAKLLLLSDELEQKKQQLKTLEEKSAEQQRLLEKLAQEVELEKQNADQIRQSSGEAQKNQQIKIDQLNQTIDRLHTQLEHAQYASEHAANDRVTALQNQLNDAQQQLQQAQDSLAQLKQQRQQWAERFQQMLQYFDLLANTTSQPNATLDLNITEQIRSMRDILQMCYDQSVNGD